MNESGQNQPEIVTADQMRALEAAAIAAGHTTGAALMEQAGQGAAQEIIAEAGTVASQAVVLCGPGNNGGDGYVIARHLRAAGWRVCLLASASPRSPDAADAAARWQAAGGTVAALEQLPHILPGLARIARPHRLVLVDALLGLGQSRSPAALLAPVLRALDDLAPDLPRPRVVAVDMPTGLETDTGAALCPRIIAADLVITFHACKPVHRLLQAQGVAVRVVPLDLSPRPPGQTGQVPMIRAPRIFTLTEASAAALRKAPGAHKYDHGHALILSGGLGRSGAARLAARAALRIGAGLVTLAVPDAAIPEVACQITAIMLRPLGRPKGAEAALRDLLADRRISALCLGPGLGLSAREAGLVGAVLRDGRPAVLDADALTLMARDDGLRQSLHAGCILTPHDGEFARLCPDLATGLGASDTRAAAVQAAAARLGCTVVLKGPASLVASPDGRSSAHPAAQDGSRAWLATAGSGDVLAGLMTGLLARALPPHQAADLAVALHAAAAARFGPGLIAEDLPDTIPAVLRDLTV